MISDTKDRAEFFECCLCGDCCAGFGGTRVSEQDIEKIARYMEIPPEELKRNYVERAGQTFQIAQKADGRCVFWNELCTIHPVKPRMCRAWPFIEAVLREPANWGIMAGMCPGIKTDVDYSELCAFIRREISPLDNDAS
jgi:hypothetical protein